MVAEAIGVGQAMVMLKTLVMLRLGWMLVLGVLIVIKQVRYSSPSTIQPAIMALLMVLGIHGGRDLATHDIASEGGRGKSMAPASCSAKRFECRQSLKREGEGFSAKMTWRLVVIGRLGGSRWQGWLAGVPGCGR